MNTNDKNTSTTQHNVVSGGEQALRALLAARSLTLSFPDQRLEENYRYLVRDRAARLLRRSIFGLIAIYLIVVVPISLFSDDPALAFWQACVLVPIGAVLATILVFTRIQALAARVEQLLAASLVVSLGGTLYCSMSLGASAFAHIAGFQTVYILVIAFSILRIPVSTALASAATAFVFAFAGVHFGSANYTGLEILLSFFVPLGLCTVTGYLLEHGDRRQFLQTQLLSLEALSVEALHREAERDLAKQQRQAAFLQLIAGNLDHEALFSRVLRFMVDDTASLVAAGYLAENAALLRCVSTWATGKQHLDVHRQLDPEETLLGAALKQRRALRIDQVPPGYLSISCGSGEYQPGALLILPICYADQTLAVLELGRFQPYSDDEVARLEALVPHFAFALAACSARQHDDRVLPASA